MRLRRMVTLPQVVEQDILFLQKIHRQKNSFNTPGLPLL
jgi:hypothetical protein